MDSSIRPNVTLFFMPKAIGDLEQWRDRGSLRARRAARKVEAVVDYLELGDAPPPGIPLIHPLLGLMSLGVAGNHRMVYRVVTDSVSGDIDVIVFSLRGMYWLGL